MNAPRLFAVRDGRDWHVLTMAEAVEHFVENEREPDEVCLLTPDDGSMPVLLSAIRDNGARQHEADERRMLR